MIEYLKLLLLKYPVVIFGKLNMSQVILLVIKYYLYVLSVVK